MKKCMQCISSSYNNWNDRFQGLYVSGAGVTASMAQPDVGLVSMPEFCKIIRENAVASELPILADADTGFGEEEMVSRAPAPPELTSYTRLLLCLPICIR